MTTMRRFKMALAGGALCGLGLPAQALVSWAGWDTPLAVGDRVGQLHSSTSCQQHEAREWSELMARRVGAEMQQAFDDELARARLLSRPASNRANALQVSAVLQDFSQNLCSGGNGSWSGTFQVRVSWKVRQAGSRRVVYQGNTLGAFKAARATARPPAYAVRDAFAIATRNLLADLRFIEVVRSGSSLVATAASTE
jgi:ABC-type uncharacterized transport system auxiliary subunit